MFENVASMDGSDHDLVPHYLGVRPLVACASGLSQVKRKRYLWATWPMMPRDGVMIEEKPEAWHVRFQAKIPESKLWLTPGWNMVGEPEERFPTFMRSRPQKKRLIYHQEFNQPQPTPGRGGGRIFGVTPLISIA